MSGKSMTGWIALAFVLAWVATPLLVTAGGALLAVPPQGTVQNTPKLYIAIVLFAVLWLALGLVVMLLCLHKSLPPKLLLGALAWFVVTTAPLGSSAFQAWVRSGVPGQEFPTSFKVESVVRRSTYLRALDGPAAGKTFVVDTSVASALERPDPQNKDVRAGRVYLGKLGLWWIPGLDSPASPK